MDEGFVFSSRSIMNMLSLMALISTLFSSLSSLPDLSLPRHIYHFSTAREKWGIVLEWIYSMESALILVNKNYLIDSETDV